MAKPRTVADIARDLERCQKEIARAEHSLQELRKQAKALVDEMSVLGKLLVLGHPRRTRPLSADLTVAMTHKVRYAQRTGMSVEDARQYALRGMNDLADERGESVPSGCLERLEELLAKAYGKTPSTGGKKAR